MRPSRSGRRDTDPGHPPRVGQRRVAPTRHGRRGTWNTPGVSDQHTTIFLATGVTPCPSRPEGIEEGYLTVETIRRLADLDDLVADGSLKDETTVLGLYLARHRLALTGRLP